MSQVKFTASKLPVGKKGVLAPDADGYYTLPVGSLNVFNSVGQYYVLEGARDLFKESSVLMRRIANGCLKGEMGHPKRAPGMSMEDYLSRVLTIEETNVCCHFKEVWLDEAYGRNNPHLKSPAMVAIMAKIKPSGPMGPALQASLESSSENVCFSIRSLSRDYVERGKYYKVLQQIVGWDCVTEPGLANATKWSAPALETLEDEFVTKASVQSVIKHQSGHVTMESTKALAIETLAIFDNRSPPPLFNNW